MANKVKTRNFPVDMWRTNIMQMNMTAEDKFFWVYVNTNPQTTLLGVFRADSASNRLRHGLQRANCKSAD